MSLQHVSTLKELSSEVYLMHSSSVGQQNESPDINLTSVGSFCWLTLQENRQYSSCRWHFKGWNML